MSNKKYLRDNRTEEKYYADLVKFQKKTAKFLHRFCQEHSEPIEILDIEFLGPEWDIGFDSEKAANLVNKVKQSADVKVTYRLPNKPGERKHMFVEIKTIKDRYATVDNVKTHQLDKQIKMYGKKLMVLIYNTKYEEYKAFNAEYLATLPKKKAFAVGYKEVYEVPYNPDEWIKLEGEKKHDTDFDAFEKLDNLIESYKEETNNE